MAWQLVAVGAACGSLGAGFGWVLAMVMVADAGGGRQGGVHSAALDRSGKGQEP